MVQRGGYGVYASNPSGYAAHFKADKGVKIEGDLELGDNIIFGESIRVPYPDPEVLPHTFQLYARTEYAGGNNDDDGSFKLTRNAGIIRMKDNYSAVYGDMIKADSVILLTILNR